MSAKKSLGPGDLEALRELRAKIKADFADKQPLVCAFCDKTQKEVLKMVQRDHRGVAICNECVVLSFEAMIKGNLR